MQIVQHGCKFLLAQVNVLLWIPEWANKGEHAEYRDLDLKTPGIGKCPILGILGHHLIVAIIDHIPNGWVMFNGDI